MGLRFKLTKSWSDSKEGLCKNDTIQVATISLIQFTFTFFSERLQSAEAAVSNGA